MKLEELPQDDLLELAQRLNVRDLLAFLSTCHVIRQLQFQRSLWLGALIRLKEIELQPLPLSTATPLETLSLLELQSVARRADRLKRNWQSNNPRLVHLRRFSLPSRARIVFVPGAHLAVAYNSDIISCWDILSSQRVAHLEIPDLVVRAEALCTDINGKVLIWASIDWLPRNLAVICIDFRDCAHISISHVVSPATTDTYSNPIGFFIDTHGTGFVDGAKLVFWCMDPDVAVQTTSLELTGDMSSTGTKHIPPSGGVYVQWRNQDHTTSRFKFRPYRHSSHVQHGSAASACNSRRQNVDQISRTRSACLRPALWNFHCHLSL
ncbi:hypothetical protein DFH08DRAFT_125102 [Mycena albidolilacea]|uniref:F-box domain-containing protein n=1 Tax=Mycena albidolilacea TaxID=1033008 RepID=A0AAD7A677_9AGAR|nr:hypothetical protein DFH08DRAFT_125102 [Mycena albidolilacea]